MGPYTQRLRHRRYHLFQKQNKHKCTINHFNLPVIWEMKNLTQRWDCEFTEHPSKPGAVPKPQNYVQGIPPSSLFLLTSAWRPQSSPCRRPMSQRLKPVSDCLCSFVTWHLVARSGLSPALRPSVQTTQRHLEGSALSHTAPTPQDMQAGEGR